MGFAFSDAQLERFRQAVARDVTAAFWDVLAARELETIARQDLTQKERVLDETTKRQSAGTATDFDVLAARVAVENARPVVIRSQNNVRTARDRLAFLLAETESDIDVTGSLEAVAGARPRLCGPAGHRAGPSSGASRGRHAEGHLRRTGDHRQGRQQAARRLRGGVGIPKPGVAHRLVERQRLECGLFATVPLFDGQRTKGRVAQARSELATLSIEELKLRDSIAIEVRIAIQNAAEALEILAASRGTVEQAERLLFLSERAYDLGVKTRLDVQDSELKLSQARVNLARAQRDYRVALVNLDWVAGTPISAGGPMPTVK